MKYSLRSRKRFLDKHRKLKQCCIIIIIKFIYTFHSSYCVKLKVQYYITYLLTYLAGKIGDAMTMMMKWRESERGEIWGFESSRVSSHSGFQGCNTSQSSYCTHHPSHASDIKPDNGHGPPILTWHAMSSCHSQIVSNNSGVKVVGAA